MKRRKTATLPRVWINAMSRRDLIAYRESMDKLAAQVGELGRLVAEMRAELDRLKAQPPRPRRPVAATSEAPQTVAAEGNGGVA